MNQLMEQVVYQSAHRDVLRSRAGSLYARWRVWALVVCVMAIGACVTHAQTPGVQPADADTAAVDYSAWAIPKQFTKLAAHPRLFASEAEVQRMVKGRGEEYAKAYEQVKAAADAGVLDQDNPLSDPALYKGFMPLQRSFMMFGRLLSLAEQYHISHDRKYLDAAVKNILGMKDWLPPDGPIELWQGQEIGAIAIAYDLIYNDATEAQRKQLVAFAQTHCIRPFLMNTGSKPGMVKGEHGSWWLNKVINWNPVCTAGAGMLALTMYEDLPEAQLVIDRVMKSYDPILDYLKKTNGGWWEGLGYWNWTMHYMSLFYISYERATGTQVPGFHSDAYREGLLFGMYFVPYAEACGFGDNQHGNFSNSVMRAAEFLGDQNLLKQMQDYHARFDKYATIDNAAAEKKAAEKEKSEPAADANEDLKPTNIGYGAPMELLIKPDPLTGVASPQPVENFVKIYPDLGWAVIADRWPEPSVYASVRGGPIGNGGGHAHNNLLSWNGVVGTERMIVSYQKASYYGPSFGPRAWDIHERSARAKNTIFVAGLAPAQNRRDNAEAAESSFKLPVGIALRLDARSAYPASVVRLFVQLGHHGLLVLDRVERAGGPVEVRTHTMKEATFANDSVLLKGSRETARMTFAADHPAVLRQAVGMVTDARATPPTVMRWQTLDKVNKVTMASLLTVGGDEVKLTVTSDETTVTVIAVGRDWKQEVHLTTKLQPINESGTADNDKPDDAQKADPQTREVEPVEPN